MADIKVLVVDDEEDIVIDAKDILEKKGFRVFTALDSDAAMDIFKKESPQICLLDVHMPKSKLSGIEMLKEIRSLVEKCYCIMLTRITDKDKIEDARRLGAKHYVLKPLDYRELMKLMDEAVKEIQTGGA